MFDRSAMREGQRVKISYRDTSQYSGVTGLVVQADTDRLVVRSEKSGRDVSVSFENIAELESWTRPRSVPRQRRPGSQNARAIR